MKGFFGTGKIVFVCERPSTGTFPSGADNLFYDLLKEYKFEDAHITDLIKCRSNVIEKVEKSFEDDAKECFKHLLEELEILKPTLIVAVDTKVYKYLREHLSELYKDKLFEKTMTHYSYAHRFKKREKLEENFKSVKEWISRRDVKRTRTTSSFDHS
ncbi:MAG: uracil-DNA glycosylase family protein [Conexivisphaerales archaeon]